MSLETLYKQLRPKLFSIAYRLTGSAADSHDVVQEVWANFLEVADTVEYSEKYLARSVSNRSLNLLEKQKTLREQYKGIYLPEPISYEHLPFEIEQDLSFSLWLLLEKLTPIERAIFVLHESFDFDYQELAAMFGLKIDTCRQHLHRAKEHVQQQRKRFEASLAQRKQFVEVFRMASQQGRVEDLINFFKNDVVGYSDGGGKVSAALKAIIGKINMAKFLEGLAKKRNNLVASYAEINGWPGFLLVDASTHQLDTILIIEGDTEGVSALFMVRNPEKFRGVVTN